MANGIDTTAAAAKAQEPPKARTRSPRDDLAFTDRIFLAIENPVLRRELLTTLRSQKAFVLQFFFLLVLGGVVYTAWPLGETSTRAELAHKLFRTFGQSMIVMLSIMSPAFSATAMTIEKERRCIDLLLTSPIKPGTILMGKYLSSVVYLFLLVLSTAPLVSVILWLGGLGPSEIGGLYVLLLSVAAAFGMIGMACSVFFHRSQSSLAITYMTVLPLAGILFACSVGFESFFDISSSIWYSGILLITAFIMYRACHIRLRQPFDPVYKAAEDEDVATQTGLVLVRDRFPDNLLAPRREGDLLPETVNPVYQKEIRSEIFGRGTLFLRLIIQISMFMAVVFLTFLFMGKEYVYADYLIVFSMLVAPAFGCITFTQERERGTLDLMLTTLLRPGQIIVGKFIACLRFSLFLTGLVGVTLCFYLFIGAGQETILQRLVYLIIYLGLILVTVVFETSLAMFFSLMFRRSTQSIITTYTVLLVLFGAPVAASQLLSAFTKLKAADISWFLFVSPFEAIYSVAPKGQGEAQAFADIVRVWPWYLAFYLAASVVLMACVYAFFEKKCVEASAAR